MASSNTRGIFEVWNRIENVISLFCAIFILMEVVYGYCR